MLNKSSLCLFTAAISAIYSLSAQALDPNTASVEELADELIGVGPKLAQKIVQYRELNGNFQDIDDLMQVNGIGRVVIEKNQALLEFGP